MNKTGELAQPTAAGGAWLFSMRLAQQGISLIQVAILARLLSPEDFGLMGIAVLAIQAVGVFFYTGYEFALVQKPDLQPEDIDTAWWVMLGRRLLIGGCLALLAIPIARFYDAPGAVPILVAMALVQPIQGLASPSPILFRRNLQFRQVFELNVWSALAGLIAGTVSALVLRNVWALVLASLATTVATIVLSYMFHPYRPRWHFSRQSFRQLSDYGLWMLGSAVLWFVFSQGSSAFAGWMFGVAALGLYQMAARFALLPSTQLGDVILAAVFPAYSLMQQDVTRVSKAFLRTLSLAGMLIMGTTALIALGLPRLFNLILGEQWGQAAPLVPVIAVAGGAQAMLRIGSPLYLGTGRPRLQFFLDLAQTATMLMLLYPMGHRYGLVGLPFAMLGGVLSALPIWWLGIRRSTACTWREVGSALLPPGVGVGVMSLVFWAGQMPAALPSESALGIMWHIMLTIIAALGFLATIGISQQLIPRYSPLIEMQRVLRGVRLRLAPAFISNRNVLH